METKRERLERQLDQADAAYQRALATLRDYKHMTDAEFQAAYLETKRCYAAIWELEGQLYPHCFSLTEQGKRTVKELKAGVS